MLVENILVIVVAAFLLGFGGAIFGICWVPTKRKQYEIIAKTAKLKPGMVFCDLGSGTGSLLFYLAKNYKVQCVGVEISPVLYLYSKIKSLFYKNISIKFNNFFNYNLAGCDVVYFYLHPKLMPKIIQKLQKELKPGALVISYGFVIPGYAPEKFIEQPGQLSVYFYHNMQ
ncbi:MAG: methyltransferase domain-containing protein [Candidatus Pacebacteria bacterium]|nr:methyltransferase domain-containing protein [Candidatus Paceibacterota bacterium]